jgi:hypothetical protein
LLVLLCNSFSTLLEAFLVREARGGFVLGVIGRTMIAVCSRSRGRLVAELVERMVTQVVNICMRQAPPEPGLLPLSVWRALDSRG